MSLFTNLAQHLDRLTAARQKRTEPIRPQLSIPGTNYSGLGEMGMTRGSAAQLLEEQPGADDWDRLTLEQAEGRRRQLAPGLQGIAQIGMTDDLPVITGRDFARRNQILEGVRAGQQTLNPGNVRQAFRPNDPLAERNNVERLMGQSIPDAIDSMRINQHARPRTIEDAQRIAAGREQFGNQMTLNRQGIQGNLDLETLRGDNAFQVEGLRGANALNVTEAEGWLARGLEGMRGKNALAVTGLEGQNALGLEGTRGRNALAVTGLEGENAIGLETLRGQNGGPAYLKGLEDGFKANQYGAASRQGSTSDKPSLVDRDGNPVVPPDGMGQRAAPSQAYIDRLKQMRNDPNAIAKFEERFGPGSAAPFLR